MRGWLYLRDGTPTPIPAVVMAHGFSGVKEQYLDDFAEVFAKAGLATLVFDNRNFGASEGEPRQEIDPIQQVRDYRHAITFARTLPEVDRDRIGVWGTSYSGGHVLMVGAIDQSGEVRGFPGPDDQRPNRKLAPGTTRSGAFGARRFRQRSGNAVPRRSTGDDPGRGRRPCGAMCVAGL